MAVLVLSKTPDKEEAEEIAQRVAQEYSDADQKYIVWYLDTELPTGIGVATSDQLAAHKRDAGPDACFMTVTMCNDEEVDEIYYEE
jgi:hypothetical protein